MATLIIGLLICLTCASVFIYLRVKKGGLAGLISKTVASFAFIFFALLLLATKMGINLNSSYANVFLILGLICGLIGDVLLDLKVVYPFHKDTYLYSGMTSFLIGHLFYITSLFLFAQNQINLFAEKLLPLLFILLGACALTIIIYFVSTKVIKLKYEKFSKLVNIYSFVLIFTTILSIYISCIVNILPMYILSIGFVLFLLSDLVLSMQYFGDKLHDKKLIIINHSLYYLAQIIIAMFLFFV